MTEMLKQIPYWEYLTEDEKKRAAESAYVRHYVTGEQMYGPYVECVGMIHVLKGETRAYLLSDEGREVTLFRVVQGDNCIISASCVLSVPCRYIHGPSSVAKLSDIEAQLALARAYAENA